MRSFDDILTISAERHGGRDAVLGSFEPAADPDELGAIPDDRWLSQSTRAIFQAGFNWKVVDRMWPGFETAFKNFAPGPIAMMEDAWFDALVTDTSIVRHGPKIRAVQENAVFIQEQSATHGSFGKMIGDWPSEDFAGLLSFLKSEGSRLAGATGQYFLRAMNRDGYILSRDVVARLIAEGVIDKPPTSKTAMRAVQSAFNTWSEESGQSLTAISRVLAMSIG